MNGGVESPVTSGGAQELHGGTMDELARASSRVVRASKFDTILLYRGSARWGTHRGCSWVVRGTIFHAILLYVS
jgi:hypothetical protein